MQTTLLGATAVGWCLIHSILASLPAKNLFTRVAGTGAARAYRLAYNLFALLSFAPVLLLMRKFPDRILYLIQPPWIFAMLLGQALAGVCLLLALLQTDPLHFIGMRQLVQQPGRSTLKTTGFYAVVRHPLYFLGLVVLWLTPIMTMNLLVVFVVLTLYVFVGASLEERRLLQEFGAGYATYRSRTPMIIPGLRPGKTATRGADDTARP